MTETIILDFQIDQSQAITQLKQTEKAIIALKDEQRDLNKAYKEGEISQDEYIEENLKLQQQIKKETDQKKTLVKSLETESNSRNAMRQRVRQLTQEYDNLNQETAEGKQRSQQLAAEIKKLNTEINKGSKDAGNFKDNIGHYNDGLKEAALNTDVMGQSVGGLGGQIASLANPITGAVAVLGALTAAYAQSATGARDLAFAQGVLSAGTQILVDQFGELISTGEEGEGLFSTLASGLVAYVAGFDAAAIARFNAQQKILLQQLEISAAFAQGAAKESERQAELQRRIRDDETNTLEERLEAVEKIDGVMLSSAQRTITVIKAQIEAIKNSTLNYDLNREAQLQVAQLTAEIADKEEEVTGKLTENYNARQAILQAMRDQNEEARRLAEADRRASSPAVAAPLDTAALQNEVDTRLSIQQNAADAELRVKGRLVKDIDKLNKQQADNEAARARQSADFAIDQQQRQLNATQDTIAAIGSLFEEESAAYKALAISQNFIDTYRAATAALAPPPTGAGPLFGPILAAATIIAGTANASRIAGFAEGGFTGSGSHKDKSGHRVAGIVHANEYVVPEWQVKHPAYSSMVSSLEMGRLKGYADGGLVAQGVTQPINQELALSNALKNMPQPVVSVKEITRSQDRVRTRERSTKI